MSFHAARLYNVALYEIRHHFFNQKSFLKYETNYHRCKTNENYSLLLTDMGQPIIRLAHRNFKSFLGLLKAKKEGCYNQPVSIPRYKPKQSGMGFTVHARSARRQGEWISIGFSKAFVATYRPQLDRLRFKLPEHVRSGELLEVRFICHGGTFDIEYVYRKAIRHVEGLNPEKHLSVDLGLNNLLSCFDSTTGMSFIVEGQFIKSLNQRYNKERSRLISILVQQGLSGQSRRLLQLSLKRQNRLNDYFNRVVRFLVDYCILKGIGTVVVGQWQGIKQGLNLGKVTNQNFLCIPYQKLLQKLRSQCKQVGIAYHEIEESYTSKCSFLDGEVVCKQSLYAGKRVKRGLFRSGAGVLVNADINGAANILVKYLTSTHRLTELDRERVVKGFVSNPVRIGVKQLLPGSHKAPSIAVLTA